MRIQLLMGPKDGEVIEVPDGRQEYLIRISTLDPSIVREALDSPATQVAWKTGTYRMGHPRRLSPTGETYFVWEGMY